MVDAYAGEVKMATAQGIYILCRYGQYANTAPACPEGFCEDA
jgi:hypothetical protein